MIPVINKSYCSSSQVVLVLRRRPHVTNGGGFVVTDCNQKVIFRVDGCGILGTKDELILRDGDEWKGYTFDYEGSQKLVFSLKEPNSCLVRNNAIKISTEPRDGVKKEVQELMASKDLYHVVVKPGIDQAFVFGVIATLDYIYGESMRC
ncbi:hypothetical protein ACJW30_07G006100 [Castanea mollissima]